MPVEKQDRGVVEALFAAMQAGPAGEDEMMALFAEDATLVEPFTGEVKTHTGKPAIRYPYSYRWRAHPMALGRTDYRRQRAVGMP